MKIHICLKSIEYPQQYKVCLVYNPIWIQPSPGSVDQPRGHRETRRIGESMWFSNNEDGFLFVCETFLSRRLHYNQVDFALERKTNVSTTDP